MKRIREAAAKATVELSSKDATQRTLEIAMRALQTLQSYAPDDRSVQGARAEVRRSLAALSRESRVRTQ